MRDQLIQYVNLLFAGVRDADEMRAEILQNTLDRYDDLVAQGKSPEAAYRLAISGIGDVNEIFGVHTEKVNAPQAVRDSAQTDHDDAQQKKLRGIAVAMYILCAVPLIVLSEFGLDILGLCLTIGMVAAATYIMVITSKDDDDDEANEKTQQTPRQELKKSIGKIISTIALVVFFLLSFSTGAWHSTWLIFPIAACVKGLVNAILDLKEAKNHEN